MKQFLFIRRASEGYTIPVSSFSHAEYTSDTTITLYFEGSKTGKNSTVAVVLTVTSGKATDVINSISSQVANSSATVFKYDDINDTFFTKNVTGISSITVTTPTDSVAGTNITSVGETGGAKFLREDGDGTCSFQTVPTGTPTSITVADESSDTTCFPLFATAATGDLAPKTGSNLAFNSSTGDLTVGGVVNGKIIAEIGFNFADDLNTSKVYMPIVNAQNEQAGPANSATSRVAPCNLKILSFNMRLPGSTPWNPASDVTMTIGVEKLAIGTSHFSSGNWSSVETEALVVAADQDFNQLHFTFDNAAISVGELYSMTIQLDVDPGASTNWFCSAVIEYDWSTRYTGSSAIHT